MRRVDRLFDIIQILRGAARPVSAAHIAARLEVAVRTVYRDIAVLQGSGVPIDGASGLGYVLADGFTLPPLMFTPDEVQVVAMAVQLVRRTGDRGLLDAAERVRAKVAAVLPPALRAADPVPVYVSGHGAVVAETVCMDEVRDAIRAARKLDITYLDAECRPSRRKIWPLGVAYFMEATIIGAWCELRCDYRHFRADRITALTRLPQFYPGGPRLVEGWRALQAATGDDSVV